MSCVGQVGSVGRIGLTTSMRAIATSFTWNVDAAGSWETTSNWNPTNGYPNGVTHTANFGSAITAPRTVTNNSTKTLLNLAFASGIAYTIAGSSLSLVNGATITHSVTGADHTVSAPVAIDTAATTNVSVAQSLVVTGGISGTGTLNKIGSGNLSFSGTASTFTGTLSHQIGTVSCAAANVTSVNCDYSLANTAGVVLDLAGFSQTIKTLAGGGATGGNVTLGSGTLTITGSTNTTFTGVLSGTGGLTYDGAGILTLSGVNTLSGTINVASGADLRMGSTTAFGTSPVTVASGGKISKTTGALTNANNNALNVTGTINLDHASGTTTWTWGSGNIVLGATTTFNVVNSGLTFAQTGVISGTGFDLIKTGPGTLSIATATNTYGDTCVNAGLLICGGVAQIPAAGTVFIGDTSGSTAATFQWSGVMARPLTVRSGSSGVKKIVRNTGNPTWSGAITLNDSLTIDTSTATTTISGGVTGTGNVTFTGSSTSNFTISTTAINNTGNVTATGASTGTMTNTAGLGSNVVDFIFSGSGTWLQNATNANTGVNTVSSGTVGGSGTLKGTTTVASGATLRPGTSDTSAATLNTDAVTLSTGAILRIGIGSTTTVSKFTASGTTAVTLNNNVVNFPAAALNAGTYTIIAHGASARTGTLTIGTQPTGRTFSTFTYNATSVTVTFT